MSACQSCGDKTYRELLDDNVRVRAERDEARAEIERLKGELKEAREWAKERSEFAAAETEHANRWSVRAHKAEAEVERLKGVLDSIRAARSLLGQLRDHVSDHACEELLSLLSDEPLDVDGNLHLTPSQAAYQRGAEAMREAAALCVDDRLSDKLTDAAKRIRALPVHEDK